MRAWPQPEWAPNLPLVSDGPALGQDRHRGQRGIIPFPKVADATSVAKPWSGSGRSRVDDRGAHDHSYLISGQSLCPRGSPCLSPIPVQVTRGQISSGSLGLSITQACRKLCVPIEDTYTFGQPHYSHFAFRSVLAQPLGTPATGRSQASRWDARIGLWLRYLALKCQAILGRSLWDLGTRPRGTVDNRPAIQCRYWRPPLISRPRGTAEATVRCLGSALGAQPGAPAHARRERGCGSPDVYEDTSCRRHVLFSPSCKAVP